MVLMKEYRVCMPLTVEEYQIGQLYMIARHSAERSEEGGDGVEVVENTDCEDPVHGKGQYTEKRMHLSRHLPYWVQAICPRVFYVTEKSWNYYPYTYTEYTCSFLPKLSVTVKTRYENNSGTTENCLGLSEADLKNREVDFIDIAFDDLSSPKHYKKEEDPKFFKSEKTGRGPLVEGWRDFDKPIMCSYKLVSASFEVWGFQTRVEDFIQRSIRDILLLGHRQAFTWIDDWYNMNLEDVRKYELEKQQETNEKLNKVTPESSPRSSPDGYGLNNIDLNRSESVKEDDSEAQGGKGKSLKDLEDNQMLTGNDKNVDDVNTRENLDETTNAATLKSVEKSDGIETERKVI